MMLGPALAVKVVGTRLAGLPVVLLPRRLEARCSRTCGALAEAVRGVQTFTLLNLGTGFATTMGSSRLTGRPVGRGFVCRRRGSRQAIVTHKAEMEMEHVTTAGDAETMKVYFQRRVLLKHSRLGVQTFTLLNLGTGFATTMGSSRLTGRPVGRGFVCRRRRSRQAIARQWVEVAKAEAEPGGLRDVLAGSSAPGLACSQMWPEVPSRGGRTSGSSCAARLLPGAPAAKALLSLSAVEKDRCASCPCRCGALLRGFCMGAICGLGSCGRPSKVWRSWR